MRRTPSLLALLFALGACSVLGVLIALEVRSATPDTSPRAAIEAAAKDRAKARKDRFAESDRSFDVSFDQAMVRDRVVWRDRPGGVATTDLTIVNATPGADLAASARACAEIVTKTKVQCYAFANTEAYEFKNITGDLELAEPTAIVNLCWAVMASTDTPGGSVKVNDMRLAAQVWDAQGCPDSWSGTSRETNA